MPEVTALDGVLKGDQLRVIAAGLDHPESVCWSPDEDVLYAGGEAGQLYRVSLTGSVDTVATIPNGFVLGLALDGAGNLYVCDMGNGCVHRVTPDRKMSRYGPPIAVPNCPAFAHDGRLYVSDSGDWDGRNGGVLRIDPDGASERLEIPPLAFANGTAIRESHLYIVESQLPGVVRIPLDGGELEPVVTLDHCVPDGIAFDEHGGLWISCWQPNRIYRLTPNGELVTVVDDWTGEYVLSPTNTAFAGENLDMLVLASLAGWGLKAISPGVRGAALERPYLR
jgi:gluconolactonase